MGFREVFVWVAVGAFVRMRDLDWAMANLIRCQDIDFERRLNHWDSLDYSHGLWNHEMPMDGRHLCCGALPAGDGARPKERKGSDNVATEGSHRAEASATKRGSANGQAATSGPARLRSLTVDALSNFQPSWSIERGLLLIRVESSHEQPTNDH